MKAPAGTWIKTDAIGITRVVLIYFIISDSGYIVHIKKVDHVSYCGIFERALDTIAKDLRCCHIFEMDGPVVEILYLIGY